jgi:hypothetical protein
MAKHHKSSKLKRGQPTRSQIPVVLIVCEGTKTEPLYFEGFQKPGILSIKTIGVGRGTLRVVERAIKEQDDMYNQIWCVFDLDNFSPAHFNNAVAKAEKKGLRVAYSNPCFELWFALHFDYIDIENNCKDLQDKLGAKIGYDKNRPDMYIVLALHQQTALRNADRLYKSYPNAMALSNKAPSTTVYLLVEELNHLGTPQNP